MPTGLPPTTPSSARKPISEPAVSFSSQNIPQLAEGEGPQWRAFSTLRWATSSNHVFGHDVSSGETFTWLHSPVFRATPLDMKSEADIDFIMGENQIICHGWPYSPPDHEVPEPGWSLYAAAVFNNHNPWHPVMPAVTGYIGRMSYLMRQGKPANQVAILLPTDDAWAGFQPNQTSITNAMPQLISPQLMSAILSAGYNIDYIDADAINKVGLGDHQILVIPPTDRIPLETLKKIAAFVAAGGKVIAVGRAPSIDPEGKTASRAHQLVEAALRSGQVASCPTRLTSPTPSTNAAKPDFQLPADDSVATHSARLHPPQAPRRRHLLRRQHRQPTHRHHRFLRHRTQVRRSVGPRLHRRHSGFGGIIPNPPGAV